eukprot:TRINITY_DN12635_c0_g1_i3.p1 TRINITY_DN12635_c0_g1~~TRINITY_DN12635_c0_g1_i3.p1  ORF type:complete len:231 (+),score=50.03 TRINITY_DN12635_c0_g1_i3:152-844(+)
MCIRDRYQRRVRGSTGMDMEPMRHSLSFMTERIGAGMAADPVSSSALPVQEKTSSPSLNDPKGELERHGEDRAPPHLVDQLVEELQALQIGFVQRNRRIQLLRAELAEVDSRRGRVPTSPAPGAVVLHVEDEPTLPAMRVSLEGMAEGIVDPEERYQFRRALSKDGPVGTGQHDGDTLESCLGWLRAISQAGNTVTDPRLDRLAAELQVQRRVLDRLADSRGSDTHTGSP